MKKSVAIILTITMAGVLFVGCGKKTESSNSLQAVQKAGKLTIGLDDSYPPMEFRDSNDKLVGFDIDLGDAVAKKMGVKSEYITNDFNGMVLALGSSKFNVIISAMSITDDRKKSINFSDSYVMGGQVAIIKQGNTKINKIDDLKGKTVACQLGSTGDTAATAMKGLKEVKKYDKITDAYQDLSIGRVDAVVLDAQVGQYYVAKKPGEYKVLDEQISQEPIGIGFKKQDKELQVAVQKAIDELKADGTLSKLSQKWFGFDAYKK
ncbi:ABC transporter substrate-binding protein [Clostridium lacusfryxellense]|uniref:ABC transporter substrate-binding protein n=1 Tax=Clostridium lacusfryxellense TaxID=205328 RepID=UPI001C0DA41B|nr:ABC transporter substrate-binding protein [Clostridium lacusfryxellense]MBU3112426.1 ABC transporter substrate-binding protein [Clostridium lacusfryxellense]